MSGVSPVGCDAEGSEEVQEVEVYVPRKERGFVLRRTLVELLVNCQYYITFVYLYVVCEPAKTRKRKSYTTSVVGVW